MKFRQTLTVMQRFCAKVKLPPSDDPMGCWIWIANRSTGYGRFWLAGRYVTASRFSYEMFIKAVPAGKEIDHLCRVRCCVNPDHLEAVTHRVNMLRGDGVASSNVAKTHCAQGHPYSGSNLHLQGTKRRCRRCWVIATKRYRERKAAA
jgi:hypothetical protein